MATGTECAFHKHSEEVPLEVHHIWPLGYRGPDIWVNKVKGCANGHGMVHYLIEFTLKTEARGQTVSWFYRRKFGKKVRMYADRGVRCVLAQQMVE